MKHKWTAIPVVILVAVLIFVLSPKRNKDIPENLIGQWTTLAPGYQDRFIELTKETLVYGIGGDKKDVYIITSLEKNPEGKNIIYTINFKNSEVKFTRSFNYHPENGGTIQFKHQEHITWRKKANTDMR
jgi:hypothetical protein